MSKHIQNIYDLDIKQLGIIKERYQINPGTIDTNNKVSRKCNESESLQYLNTALITLVYQDDNIKKNNPFLKNLQNEQSAIIEDYKTFDDKIVDILKEIDNQKLGIDNKIISLKIKFNDANDTIDNIKTNETNVNKKISDINDSIKKIDGKTKKANKDVININKVIASLEHNVSNAEDDLNNIKTKITKLESDTDSVSKNFTTLTTNKDNINMPQRKLENITISNSDNQNNKYKTIEAKNLYLYIDIPLVKQSEKSDNNDDCTGPGCYISLGVKYYTPYYNLLLDVGIDSHFSKIYKNLKEKNDNKEEVIAYNFEIGYLWSSWFIEEVWAGIKTYDFCILGVTAKAQWNYKISNRKVGGGIKYSYEPEDKLSVDNTEKHQLKYNFYLTVLF